MNAKEKETIVIALGGNALSSPHGKGSIEEQMEAIGRSCQQIARIVRSGTRVVLTHGNGPQVGQILIQQEQAKGVVPPLPLDVCGAMTQGQIGYLLQQALAQALRAEGLKVPVVTVVTQVVVSSGDPAFKEPTKPIGPFYSKSEAEWLHKSKGYVIKRMGSGHRAYRRVVPSPYPREIVEGRTICRLVTSEHVVIACGGGGVPVIREGGRLRGIEAVIDKDLASERLASALGAQALMILTDVERVALHFGTPEQINLERLSVEEAKRYLAAGEFPSGSMGPKIEAAIRFLGNGGERAIITSLDRAQEALAGQAGTQIVRVQQPT
ncbi:MAG: carbamate kinase [Candidatus Fraserbacteria bacterium RBG_16_55_9]|uniref:Carbamate kinase n=1 Tax=Fraserbacteria sp. (strain RBG_16_55_9) TaxID=1817864 RepID=A0A1F5UXI9_FRAXR|nr:MAG: carbamate kinase [Candidatus Fraserbacteria bacterium RBG_16_55_9]